ncbi:MAG TPA: hypothetical protein VH637_10170 [Streptosporangiaceae bacterium]|jgi:quinol monooxygenase YgiN
MSVLVLGKFRGDTGKFRQALTDRADEFVAISDRARMAGGISHRFGIGDGVVVIADEWESADQFRQFLADPRLQQFISEIGAQGEPEITITEAVVSADQF